MPNFNSRRWTKEDIAKLKNLAQKYPTASVAGQLGRSAAATAIKAHELKLSLKMQRRNTLCGGKARGDEGFRAGILNAQQ